MEELGAAQLDVSPRGGPRRHALLRLEAEDGPGGHVGARRSHRGTDPERRGFRLAGMGAEPFGQIDAEVGKREIRDRHAGGEILEIDDRLLELEELLATVFQIVHLVARILLDEVFLAGGGDVEEHHPAADALLEVDVFLELDIGPEVDQLDPRVAGAEPVDPAEPLDDADGIPVEVVVDEPIAILQILPFGDAVGGDQ